MENWGGFLLRSPPGYAQHFSHSKYRKTKTRKTSLYTYKGTWEGEEVEL